MHSEDVQVVDVAEPYGLLSVQGPKAERVVKAMSHFSETPAKPLRS